MERKARVLIADDQVLYREALAELIDRWSEFEVVAEASNGVEAVKLACELKPDIVLMDVRMPGMDGVEATRIIKQRLPETAVVALTVETRRECVFDALQAGANGYLLKDTPTRRLRDRLRSVVQGEAVLSGAVTGCVVREFTRLRGFMGEGGRSDESSFAVPADDLTSRERDLLRLLAHGKSNEEIASELYLSIGAVKKQVSSLMLRLCLENRVQVAVYAVKAGLDK